MHQSITSACTEMGQGVSHYDLLGTPFAYSRIVSGRLSGGRDVNDVAVSVGSQG